jgi:hypothetical protein
LGRGVQVASWAFFFCHFHVFLCNLLATSP